MLTALVSSSGSILLWRLALFILINFLTPWTLTCHRVKDAGFSCLFVYFIVIGAQFISVRTYIYCWWKINLCRIQDTTSLIVWSMSYNINKSIFQNFFNLLFIVHGYTLRGETFVERLREVKKLQISNNKLSPLISDNAFRGNSTFSNFTLSAKTL